MKHLLLYFKKYRWESILAPLFKMLEAGFDLMVPLVVAGIIDVGIANRDTRQILIRVGVLLLMAILGLLCSFTAQYFAAKAAVGTATGLRRSLLQKIQSLPVPDLERQGSAKLITRMVSDVNQVQNGVNMFLRLFLRSPFIVFGALVLAFSIHKGISLVFLGVIAVLFVIVFGIMALTKPLYRQQNQQLEGVAGATREELNGVRVIRAFGTEKQQQERFEKNNQRLQAIQEHAGKIASYMNPLTYVVINAGLIGILWLGGMEVHVGALQTGEVMALVNYASQILVELVKLANLLVLLGKAMVSMDRVGQMLDAEATVCFAGDRTGAEADTILSLEQVGLRYPGAGDDSLSGVSVTLKAGQTLGIIGGTGSGKTTLVNLISRMYPATEGQILLKGEPINQWSQTALRRTVAVAEQKATLFSGTIRSNLLFGNESADDEALWRALEIAQAAEFVREKKLGLDDPVEQGGRNLSGGQKQRLTIARALVADPDILILDDSASALDYATERNLRQALKELNKTLVIVSQRTASISHADQILVLEDGQLVGSGTHTELLDSCPAYGEIHGLQFPQEGAL